MTDALFVVNASARHDAGIAPSVLALASEWGWKSPLADILALAEQSSKAKRLSYEEILDNWHVLPPALMDALLQRRPHTMQPLEWLAEQAPGPVMPVMEKIQALKNGHAYYANLKRLTPHKSLSVPQVVKRCEELDAVLMMIEGATAVLVFSTYAGMLKYSVMGNAARATDPIQRQLADGRKLVLAVGARDDVSALLKMYHDGDGDDVQTHSARSWQVKPDDASSSPEERELARIFDHAIREQATDISFKPLRSGQVEVYMRKWGSLIRPFKRSAEGLMATDASDQRAYASTAHVLSYDLASKAINLLQSKSSANETFTRVREPKDGQIDYKSATASAFMRLNFIPLMHLGEYKDLRSVSVRLFSRAESSIQLSDLNLPTDVIDHISDAVQMPQGLILLSGPVNSGKSSTIAGAVGEHVRIFGDTKKRMSVEDPIERFLPGIIQINVPTHITNQEERFNVVLRGLKRHDLNLLWVGEVRDTESAEFCTSFASSGHIVLSTIHAKDSILAFDILSQMTRSGTRFQLAESMSLSISQRLVKTLCPHCSQRDCIPNAEEVRVFDKNLAMTGEQEKLPARIARANPAGCTHCDAGYAGSTPICEVLPFTRSVKDAALSLLNGEDPKGQRAIIASGRAITLLQSGLRLLAQGKVDLRSILFF